MNCWSLAWPRSGACGGSTRTLEIAVDDEARGAWNGVVDEAEENRSEDGLFERHPEQDIDAGHGAVLGPEPSRQHREQGYRHSEGEPGQQDGWVGPEGRAR